MGGSVNSRTSSRLSRKKRSCVFHGGCQRLWDLYLVTLFGLGIIIRRRHTQPEAFMNLKLIVAIVVIAAVPVCARAQKPSAVTKADAQKVVKIISGDKAKTQIYCDIAKLGDQIEQADEKKALELSKKMDELGKQLGPEYVALTAGLQDIDPDSPDGQQIGLTLDALDKLCGG
jgi:hypothetical protein